MPMDKIKTYKIKVDEFEKERVDMFTLFVDPSTLDKKPILIFLHGYCASSVLYYNMFKDLSEHFSIICVDQVGFGASS